jgi:CBS domain-containing protein
MRKERSLDCLLVVKEEHLVGIVTEHDILNITAASQNNSRSLLMTLEQ